MRDNPSSNFLEGHIVLLGTRKNIRSERTFENELEVKIKKMKNENIHKKFDQCEVRDFLAQELREGLKESGLVSVKYAEEQIKHFQKLLKYAKKFDAVRCLMGERGWEDWDISDYISYSKEAYFPFVGTKKENTKLLEMLKKE